MKVENYHGKDVHSMKSLENKEEQTRFNHILVHETRLSLYPILCTLC